MAKKIIKKANGNVFKTVVRQVVKEELRHVDKRLDHVDRRFDKIDQKFEQLDEKIDNTFRQYRDDVLTKMDEVVVGIFCLERLTFHHSQTWLASLTCRARFCFLLPLF